MERLLCHRCGQVSAPGESLGARCPNDGSALIPEGEHRQAPDDLLLGRILGGKYPVVGLLGAGGMGAVYRALQEPVGREVAVKIIRPALDYDQTALRARFLREAKVASRLTDPSAVTLYDYGVEPDGVLFMVLELVKGARLDCVLAAEGPFAPKRAVALTRQILRALTEAHSLGLIHRDLKPENVMLIRGPWDEEHVKVLDFGIAKVLGGGAVPKDALETRTGTALGTPRYMAPEQAVGQAEARSDLYSVGVMLFQMVSGKLPFDGKTPVEVLLAHRDMPIPPLPSELGVPLPLEIEIRKAMAKQPGDRHGNAQQMAAALVAAVPEGSETSRGGQVGQTLPSVQAEDLAQTVRPGSAVKPSWPEKSQATSAVTSPLSPPASQSGRSGRSNPRLIRMAVLFAAAVLCLGAAIGLGLRSGGSSLTRAARGSSESDLSAIPDPEPAPPSLASVADASIGTGTAGTARAASRPSTLSPDPQPALESKTDSGKNTVKTSPAKPAPSRHGEAGIEYTIF